MIRYLLKTALAIMLFHTIIGAVINPYTVNTWLVFFDKAPTFTWWQGAILGFVPGAGELTIPAAGITWVLMLFIT